MPPTPTVKCLLIRWLWKPREILLNVLFIFCVLLVINLQEYSRCWCLGVHVRKRGAFSFQNVGRGGCVQVLIFSSVPACAPRHTHTSVVSSHDTSLWSSREGCHK